MRVAPALFLLAGCGAGDPDSPHVILITIESLRPDHLASFSGPRLTTPFLDALAEEGVRYTDAHAVTSWTLASHASLFTGLYPSAHRAVEPLSRLGADYDTLAEHLAGRGYQTAGFASGPYLRREHDLDQGFEHYDDSPAGVGATAHGNVTGTSMRDAIAGFLERERDPERPLFLFGYFWDPHYDYIPPPPFDQVFVDDTCAPIDLRNYETTATIHSGTPAPAMNYVHAQYDGEIRWTDQVLGQVFEALRGAGVWDDALVIVTSDHGEEFFEHGHKGHKHNLYVETVHVPLIVRYPGGAGAGRRDGRLVSLVDLFPTILEATDTSTAVAFHGRSLLAPADPDRRAYFELLTRWYLAGPDGQSKVVEEEEWTALRTAREKLVWRPGSGQVELYDVAADPGERSDRARADPERAGALRDELAAWRAAVRAVGTTYGEGGSAELSEEMLENLRSLGYLK